MGYISDLRKLVGHRPLIFVGATVILTDNLGRILLQQRKYPKGSWGIPGGLMELGESTEDVARRELFEESNLSVGQLHLINVYSGSDQFIIAENGDEFYTVTIAYYSDDYEGEMKVDNAESINFEFFYPDEMPEGIVKSHQKMLNDFLENHYTCNRDSEKQ